MSQYAQVQTRHAAFELEGRAADAPTIPTVVSSDAPVEMPDGVEILVHTPDAVDLQRAPLPIIATHRGGQVNVGVVEDLRLAGGQLRGHARFGTRPEAAGYRDDVLGGVIRSVSVGYARVKATVRGDGVIVTSRWMPSHVALVAEPADVNAGFFRGGAALPPFELTHSLQPPAAPAAPRKESPVDQTTDPAAGAHADAASAAAAIATTTQTRSLPAQPRQGPGAVEMEAARRRGIANLCKANGIDDAIREHWIGTGLSIDAISDELLQIVQSRASTRPQTAAALGLSEGETRRYSLMSAIRACADKNWTNAGYELECSREIAKRLNVVTDPNKFFVPFEVQGRQVAAGQGSFMTAAARRAMGPQRRDLTAGTTSAGGFLVETSNMSFIEQLRNRSVSYAMGARRMSGLQGNVTVPRQTAAATAVWLANEASTLTESQQTFGQMTLSPKTVGAYTEISRQLMLQSSPDAEGIVTGDLAAVSALAIDVGVLRGSGASGEPTGIVNTAGIGSVVGTTLGYAGILEFQTDIATANVMPVRGGYVTTPSVAALMMQRVKFASTASPLWEGNLWDGEMAGFAAMSSNQLAAQTMLFGDWDKVVVGEWGVLQVEVNPYANFQAGIIGVRAMVTVDVGLRYPAAFSLASTIT